MELLSSNASDISKYYENTFVKFNEFGDRLFYINKVNKEGVYFKDANDEEGIIHLHDSYPYTISMNLPNKSMYQMGDVCYNLARIPARQYSRGISTQNCEIRSLTSLWKKESINFVNLQGYVNKPIFRPLDVVVGARTSGSEALSNRFAYRASDGSIFCDTTIVGKVNRKLKVVSCNSLLTHEFTELLKAPWESESEFKVIPL